MTPVQFKRKRIKAKMTQIKLGHYLGRSVRQIKRYEAGITKIPMIVVRAMRGI